MSFSFSSSIITAEISLITRCHTQISFRFYQESEDSKRPDWQRCYVNLLDDVKSRMIFSIHVFLLLCFFI